MTKKDMEKAVRRGLETLKQENKVFPYHPEYFQPLLAISSIAFFLNLEKLHDEIEGFVKQNIAGPPKINME